MIRLNLFKLENLTTVLSKSHLFKGTFSIGVASIESALNGQIKANKRLYTSKYMGVPRFIAVDPVRRRLYWSEKQEGWERIHKSDILARQQDIIHHALDTLRVDGISVDLKTGRVQWRNAQNNQAESVTMHGSDHRIDGRNVHNRGLWSATNHLGDGTLLARQDWIKPELSIRNTYS